MFELVIVICSFWGVICPFTGLTCRFRNVISPFIGFICSFGVAGNVFIYTFWAVINIIRCITTLNVERKYMYMNLKKNNTSNLFVPPTRHPFKCKWLSKDRVTCAFVRNTTTWHFVPLMSHHAWMYYFHCSHQKKLF